MDWLGVRNFTKEEVACKHCGRGRMSAETMGKFQAARDILNRPVYGTSWCRCPEHNAAVGGVPDSAHVFTDTKESRAGDVTLVPVDKHGNPARPMTNAERFILIKALIEARFVRLGIDRSFIHADDSPQKPQPRMWLY